MSDIFCYLKGCTKCGGDLMLNAGDWRCWQCGHYYSRKSPGATDDHRGELDRVKVGADSPRSRVDLSTGPPDGSASAGKRQRKGYGARSARNINSVIRAKELSDQRWWDRNRQIISYLDQGLSVRETALMMERDERQIRVVRERLYDLRAAAEDEHKDKR